jgi:hypothetical protein
MTVVGSQVPSDVPWSVYEPLAAVRASGFDQVESVDKG